MFAVGRADGGILVAMKNDGRRAGRASRRRSCAGFHHAERALHIGRRASRQPRMHAHSGKQVGVGVAQNRRHRAARRQAGHVNTLRVDVVALHHVTRHAGQQRRLAPASLLVVVFEPVPAARRIGVLRLRRIQHVKPAFQGGFVHARAGGKVVRVLRATVQHHHQRQRLGEGRWRNVELVLAAAGRAFGVAAADELADRAGLDGGLGRFLRRRWTADFMRFHVDDVRVVHRAGGHGSAAECGLDGGGGGLQVAGLHQPRGFGHRILEGRVVHRAGGVFGASGQPVQRILVAAVSVLAG